jgi:hypothetical protein
MLSFFQSIFGIEPEAPSGYPEHRVTQAIERAVDGTDPRLRALGDYAHELRPAVLMAINHVMSLTAGLPEPVELSRAGYRNDSRLAAFFASIEHMHEVIAADPRVMNFRLGPQGGSAYTVLALMVMQKKERTVLGMELNGERVRKDVQQTAVHFTAHRFEDLALRDEEFHDQIRRRTFDHLLQIALHRIATAREKRGELRQQQQLLQQKLRALDAGHWGFETSGEEGAQALSEADLQARIAELEAQLISMGADKGVLQIRLGLIKEVLSDAERQLMHHKTDLIVDRMGVKRQLGDEAVLELHLDEIQSALGQSMVILPVRIMLDELPSRDDLLDKAMRYLG